MDRKVPLVAGLVLIGSLVGGFSTAQADDQDDFRFGQRYDDDDERRGACRNLPSWSELRNALVAAQSVENGGFGLQMWATIVNRDGIVCAVAFTGGNRGDQWPGSRVISAQKANTANAFSLPGLALSTANIYSAVQPGGSLYGLQHSNPVATDVAYGGDARYFGKAFDPMRGRRIGGVNVFGGGLGLYDSNGILVGGIGVSGDTSCADHNIAWRTRILLETTTSSSTSRLS
jgi:uncharacterized protein GlcG (DUF336 family)